MSKTAALVTALRGRATARPDPICNDPWAAALAGDDGRAYADRFERAFPWAELWIALRTAFLDAEVTRLSAEDGPARQVVLLGSGLDTRAARLARAGVRFFEVDRAASHAAKARLVSALPDYPAGAATAVACDFEHDDFLDRLAAAGFRAGEPAVFVWEGVTYYLPEAAVRATLRAIATQCDPRTVLLFDFVGKRIVSGALRDDGDVATRATVADYGEPLRFGVDNVVPLLFEEGFRHARTVSFDELALTLTGTYERERKFRFQSIALASRATRARI